MFKPKIIFQLLAVTLLIGYCGYNNMANADQWCANPTGVCQPQCVAWARAHSDVKICGNANQWPARAAQYGSKITDTPKEGGVIVIDLSEWGHVVAVQDVDKKGDGKYSLKITHANYAKNCKDESAKATFNKSSKTLKFSSGHLNGKTFKVLALIKRK